MDVAPLPPQNSSRQFSRPTSGETLGELETAALRLEDDLRYELGRNRGPAALADDGAALLQETRHFRQSAERGEDRGHLGEDAEAVMRLLVQLNRDLERSGRYPESERSLLRFARILVAVEDDLGLRQADIGRQPQPPRPPAFPPAREPDYPMDFSRPSPLQRFETPAPSARSIPPEMKGIALLPPEDQAAALRQGTCPVNGEKLGSMGKPIKVRAGGRDVFVCCKGCVNAVQSNPQKYLPRAR